MKLSLAPRYRLDDDSSWLLAIDPVRRYWIAINGDERLSTEIAGLLTSDKQTFREVILQFRALTPGETLESLLMTAHSDWIANPEDLERSRQFLAKSWEKSLVA